MKSSNGKDSAGASQVQCIQVNRFLGYHSSRYHSRCRIDRVYVVYFGPIVENLALSQLPFNLLNEGMSEENPELESEYFGPIVENLALYQLPFAAFNASCANNRENDSTGLRIYSGGHVAIRLLLKFSFMTERKKVIELGCGTGALGLVGTMNVLPESLVLTDGEEKTVALALKNMNVIDSFSASVSASASSALPSRLLSRTSCRQLVWGDNIMIADLLNANGGGFDVAIACELMYYRTDVGLLMQTVSDLTSGKGLFLHAHLFRRYGQEVGTVFLCCSLSPIYFLVSPLDVTIRYVL